MESPHCRVQYFYLIEDSVHLKDFQPRGRRWTIILKGEVSNIKKYFECAYPCDIDGDSIPDSSVSVPVIHVRASVKVMKSVAKEPIEMTIIWNR